MKIIPLHHTQFLEPKKQFDDLIYNGFQTIKSKRSIIILDSIIIHKGQIYQQTKTNDLVNISKKNCLVFHCMPIYRNNEIRSDVADKFFEIFLKQAENRLHIQKGIMKWCLS